MDSQVTPGTTPSEMLVLVSRTPLVASRVIGTRRKSLTAQKGGLVVGWVEVKEKYELLMSWRLVRAKK